MNRNKYCVHCGSHTIAGEGPLNTIATEQLTYRPSGEAAPRSVSGLWITSGYISSLEELRDLFVPRFYFGCEADDPMVAWAFNDRINPGGAQLRPMFSSDIGHWDVPRMNAVLGEAYELVEAGHLDAEQFRTFSFENAVRFFACLDPEFFAGTRVEAEAARLLGASGGG